MKIDELIGLTHHALDVGTNKLRRSLSQQFSEESARGQKSLTLQCFPSVASSRKRTHAACEYSHPLYRTAYGKGCRTDLAPSRERKTLNRYFSSTIREVHDYTDPLADQVREEQEVFLMRSGKLKEIIEANEKKIAKLKALIKKEKLRKKFSQPDRSSKENISTFEDLARENRRLLREIKIK